MITFDERKLWTPPEVAWLAPPRYDMKDSRTHRGVLSIRFFRLPTWKVVDPALGHHYDLDT